MELLHAKFNENHKANNQLLSQQKIASQMPRGTRIDSTGSCLEVKGARNYTSNSLLIGTDEMFEDIVVRGLRSDGLSSKLGVKNNRQTIGKLINEMFRNDPRQEAVLSHFNTKRQRSNAAKTIFATLTQDELKMIDQELLPSKVDVCIRNQLCSTFSQQTYKLQHFLDVLKHLQTLFSFLDHRTELLSLHNFQSRGFFVDIINSISNFFMQVVDDAVNHVNEAEGEAKHEVEQDENAAEILLSVGSCASGGTTSTLTTQMQKNKCLPEEASEGLQDEQVSLDDAKNWASLEIFDAQGQPKCFLIKAPKQANGSLDATKLVELLNDHPHVVDDNVQSIINNQVIVTSQSSSPTFPGLSQPITTLEISLQHSSDAEHTEPDDDLPAKRRKT